LTEIPDGGAAGFDRVDDLAGVFGGGVEETLREVILVRAVPDSAMTTLSALKAASMAWTRAVSFTPAAGQ
jgi:hypothetical protein